MDFWRLRRAAVFPFVRVLSGRMSRLAVHVRPIEGSLAAAAGAFHTGRGIPYRTRRSPVRSVGFRARLPFGRPAVALTCSVRAASSDCSGRLARQS